MHSFEEFKQVNESVKVTIQGLGVNVAPFNKFKVVPKPITIKSVNGHVDYDFTNLNIILSNGDEFHLIQEDGSTTLESRINGVSEEYDLTNQIKGDLMQFVLNFIKNKIS
jgi:hypothetical protein